MDRNDKHNFGSSTATLSAAAHVPTFPVQRLATAHTDGSLRLFSISEKKIRAALTPCGECSAPTPVHTCSWLDPPPVDHPSILGRDLAERLRFE
eukprot:gene1085-biopygen6109